MRSFYGMVLLALLYGCSGESNQAATSAYDAAFGKEFVQPLKFDSAFVQSHPGDSIDYTIIRSMKGRFLAHEIASDFGYLFNSFCEIDSLKSVGRYQQYVDSLTIGMTENATAAAIGHTMINGARVLLWRLSLNSYDACPYYQGSFIIGSFMGRDSVTHLPFAKLYSAADPPSFMEEKLESELRSDVLTLSSLVISDDDSEEAGEAMERHALSISFRGQPRVETSVPEISDSRPNP